MNLSDGRSAPEIYLYGMGKKDSPKGFRQVTSSFLAAGRLVAEIVSGATSRGKRSGTEREMDGPDVDLRTGRSRAPADARGDFPVSQVKRKKRQATSLTFFYRTIVLF